MARLTDAEKEANKLKAKAHRSAFQQRQRLYRQERDAGELAVESTPEYAAMKAAVAELDSRIEARNAEDADLLRQIRELEERRKAMAATWEPIITAAKQERSRSFDVVADLKRKATDKVDAKFPDMVGVFYQSQWTPPTK